MTGCVIAASLNSVSTSSASNQSFNSGPVEDDSEELPLLLEFDADAEELFDSLDDEPLLEWLSDEWLSETLLAEERLSEELLPEDELLDPDELDEDTLAEEELLDSDELDRDSLLERDELETDALLDWLSDELPLDRLDDEPLLLGGGG